MKKQISEKFRSINRKLHGVSLTNAKRKQNSSDNKVKKDFDNSLTISYNLMGNKILKFIPLFKDLDQTILKSGLKYNFKAYVSLTILTSLLVTIIVGVFLPITFFFLLNMSFVSALLFGIGGALFSFALSILGFYLYPVYCADKRKRELDDEMPFTVGYMSILATAGVSPEKIFSSISTLNDPLAASTEAKEVITNINLFGLDIISALEKVSSRTSSLRFKDIIEGIISTIHSGGDLGTYLRGKFESAMKLKKLSLKKYSDNLSVLSEVYVALLLTGPLILVILVSVMSALGGSDMGLLNPELLLSLLTYLAIPILGTIFLIILDTVSPKW
jgi:flagellar protein FlaJ